MAFVTRRVITGLTPDGRSVIERDERPEAPPANASGISSLRLWTAPDAPPDVLAPSREAPLLPGGSSLTVVEFLPETEANAAPVPARPASSAADELFHRSARDPAYHYTETLDYVIVLSGEIWLTVGADDVQLKAGDCVVQRGTWHKWQNRGKEKCVIAAVMVRAKPLKNPPRES
jgi:mannose-6-phosphate isomerase-like protein (cupin superfamily)